MNSAYLDQDFFNGIWSTETDLTLSDNFNEVQHLLAVNQISSNERKFGYDENHNFRSLAQDYLDDRDQVNRFMKVMSIYGDQTVGEVVDSEIKDWGFVEKIRLFLFLFLFFSTS